jgi:hypothetical protein
VKRIQGERDTMLVKMSDDKNSSKVEPTIIVTPAQVSGESNGNAVKKGRLTKKHVLIAVICLLITGLLVTGALVGIKLYTDNSLDIVKYQMSFKDKDNSNATQTVSVGDGDNTVIYHVTNKDGGDITVVNDFNRNIQVAKIESGQGASCYASVLNRSMAMEPNAIKTTAPSFANETAETVVYKPMADAITDIAFLGPRVNKMCSNVPTYWASPECNDDTSTTSTTTSIGLSREKRQQIKGCCNKQCHWEYYCKVQITTSYCLVRGYYDRCTCLRFCRRMNI